MAHKLNFGQKFLVRILSLIMISILIPLTAEVVKASCPLPSFVTNRSFPSGTSNQGAAVGDVNNDGKLDIVTTNNIQPNNQISVMLGIGDGTFQSPVNTSTENGAARIVLADFNNDGKLDVAITINQAAGVIAVHLGNGNGTFGFSDIFSAGNFPNRIHSADFNNDGKRDIVFTGRTVATGIDHFGVMFGTGTGTFGTPTYYPFNNQHGMIETLPIDINQDNFIDLVATISNLHSYPFINNGNGTFTALTSTLSMDETNGRNYAVPTSAAVGDFNADGRNEVAVGFENGFFAHPRVGILFRNGASNAQQPFVLRDWFRVWGSGGSLSDIAAADFNGDGRSDLAFLDSNSQNISIQLDTTVITNGTGSPPITLEQRIGDNATNYYAGIAARQV
ncbi:FG-GAP-like repeat-containing protein [soil metagenome]